MNIRDLIAWGCFAPGVLLILVDIVRLKITGVALLGLIFLVVWLWGIRVFTAAFWIADGPTDLSNLDRRDGLTEWDRDEAARARDLDEYLDTWEQHS